MKRIGNEGKRVDGITWEISSQQELYRGLKSQRLQMHRQIPVISSSKKNAESITSRMMILLVLERPMVNSSYVGALERAELQGEE